MSTLLWLLIPVGVTVLAALLVAWARPRRSVENYDQVEQFHRFCEAMEDETTKRGGVGRGRPITRAVE